MMSCTIFQRNTDLLIIYQNINNFTQETLYPSFISKKNGMVSIANFFWNNNFFQYFHYFQVSEVCNISSKYWLLNKSANKTLLHKTSYAPPFFQIKFVLSIAQSFRNIHFLLHFWYFWQWLRCAIFQINTNLLTI